MSTMETIETKKRLLRTTHRYAANTTTTMTSAASASAAVQTTPMRPNNSENYGNYGGYGDAPSKVTPTSSSEDDAELQSRGISIVDTNTKNFSDVTPEEVSDYYKSLGEWQNVLPKTDYTYSPMSQYYTKKFNGKIPIIPNMSRKNIWKMNGEVEQNDINNYLVQNYAYDERRRLQRRKEPPTRLKIIRQATTVTRTVLKTVVHRVYVNTVRTYSSVVYNSNRSSGGSFLFSCLALALILWLIYLLLPSGVDSNVVSTPFLNLFYACKNLVFYLYHLTRSSCTFLLSLISCFLNNVAQAANTLVFAPIFRLFILLVSSDHRKTPDVRKETFESHQKPDLGDLDAVIRRWFDENVDSIAKKMVGSNDFVNFINEKFRAQEQSEYAKFEKFLQNYDFENTKIGAKLKSLEENVAQWRSADGRVLEERIREVKEQIKIDESLVHQEITLVLASLVGAKPSEDVLRKKFASVFDLLEDAHGKINKLASEFDIYTKNATENSHISDRLREELLYNLKVTVEDTLLKRLQEWKQSVRVEKSTTPDHIDIAENYVSEAIRKALEIYDADKTGKPDFALESQGGIILSTRCTETKTANAQFSIFGIPLWHATRSPRTVIQPGVHPGECWAFPGSTGYLVIQLSEPILITGFTMEHIPRSLASNGVIDSAPKDFSVWALQWESDPEPRFLGEFRYDDFGYSVQYFDAIRLNEPYPIIELKILSNHGKMDYTCLYRFRVHGIPA